MSGTKLEFEVRPHPSPVSAADRQALLANPGFGRVFTDHMVSIDWSDGKGWHDARVEPYGPLSMDPATAVLHYSQSIFEGLKAYRHDDGGVALFRPEANAARFAASARRMALPPLPEQVFVESLRVLVQTDREWIPTAEDSSLYLRPLMFANEVFLGVKPASKVRYLLIASPVGSYFAGGVKPVTVWVSEEYTRAGPGGTGAAKAGGNYAASLVAQADAAAHGCDQVVFLDAVHRRFIEELGGMNIFLVLDDGSLVTPELTGTILPGITRDSVITLARHQGRTVVERPVAFDELRADLASGRVREVFACGTAAVLTPVGAIRYGSGELMVADGGPGPVTMQLRTQLVNIQRGRAPDPFGWVQRI